MVSRSCRQRDKTRRSKQGSSRKDTRPFFTSTPALLDGVSYCDPTCRTDFCSELRGRRSSGEAPRHRAQPLAGIATPTRQACGGVSPTSASRAPRGPGALLQTHSKTWPAPRPAAGPLLETAARWRLPPRVPSRGHLSHRLQLQPLRTPFPQALAPPRLPAASWGGAAAANDSSG